MGVIGKLETPGVPCKCDGTKSEQVYKVKLNGKKIELMCKEQVIKLGFYEQWLKSWVILRVLEQISTKQARANGGRCLCKNKKCNKLLVYEVEGWYQDELVGDWETKFHLNQTGPGFKALQKWEAEGEKKARKLVY